MTTLKFKESGHKRYTRLNLGKPHIMWCPEVGSWVQARISLAGADCPTLNFCSDQNHRWTPRDKS